MATARQISHGDLCEIADRVGDGEAVLDGGLVDERRGRDLVRDDHAGFPAGQGTRK